MIVLPFVCILGLILYVAIRKLAGLGFISCHAVEIVIGVIVLGVMTEEQSEFREKVLIYFVLWSWWVFVSSVIEHSLTLRILDSLREIQVFQIYDMHNEFVSRVEKLVRSGIVVLDENKGLYSVEPTSRFYKFDLAMKRLFRIENGSLY